MPNILKDTSTFTCKVAQLDKSSFTTISDYVYIFSPIEYVTVLIDGED